MVDRVKKMSVRKSTASYVVAAPLQTLRKKGKWLQRSKGPRTSQYTGMGLGQVGDTDLLSTP